MSSLSELVLSPTQADALSTLRAELTSLDDGERLAPAFRARSSAAAIVPAALRGELARLWAAHDHFVLRGVPPSDDGCTALLVAALLFPNLRRYRGARIVKCFRMSPWTNALSHTLAEGSFHTDINTAPHPPAATLMQCLDPDPDAPTHGQLRVARASELLAAVKKHGSSAAWRLLTEERVVMVNDGSADHWSGTIMGAGMVRFHPETLRAAQRRLGANPPDLEASLRVIHEAGLSVTTPIDLKQGDVLVVSNRRALHQRGACTVRFRSFPRDFESRSVAVLHAMDELE